MKLEKRSGVVTRIFFSSSTFTAGRMQSDEGLGFETKFSTRLPVSMGEKITGLGYEFIDPKYGVEFRFQKFSDDTGTVDAEGLEYYLSHHPRLKGVGLKKAKELASKHVNTLLECLDMDSSVLAKKLELPLETIEILKKEFASSKSPKTIAKLCSFGISPRQASEIVKKWGADALKVVTEDPFRLIGAVAGFAFKKTDDVARAVGLAKTHPSRIEAGILFTLDEMMDDGHTYYEITKLIDAAVEILYLESLESRRIVNDAIDKLIERHVLINDAGSIQTTWMAQAEKDVKEILNGLKDQSALSISGKGDLDWKKVTDQLNAKQQAAFVSSMTHGVSVICGAAGTGKTYTIRNIYQTMVDVGLSPVLTAPTGKAAKRMTQLTGFPAYTIHRLLEHDGKGFTRDRSSRISYDVVIVDETSMVDTLLFAALLRALPDQCSLIMVGDPNQLPPVGPGCPFLDIIKSEKYPVVELTAVVRQSGALCANSAALLDGSVAKTIGPSWFVIDSLFGQDDVLAYVVKLFTDLIAHEKIFSVANLPQVISPMNKGVIGTKNLNAVLQKIVQQEVVNSVSYDPAKAGKIMIGDRVIQTKNNYELGIMNGNTGEVRNKRADGITVCFEGEEEVDVPNDCVGDLQLAYAITVHKSQGSEFKDVILVVHKSHSIMHDRSLIYTGATRAASRLFIIGDKWSHGASVKQVNVRSRRTILSRLLK